MGVEAFVFGDQAGVFGEFGIGLGRDFDDGGALHEIMDAEGGEGFGPAAGGQDVAGAEDKISQG